MTVDEVVHWTIEHHGTCATCTAEQR